ncbi:nitrogen permease regulator of amino acid transport activity 3-domain-containing protein [Exophiala viscosa]|uniref:nitrogen permease regulator of amino acid transport activity 3-domain-containing protein n=1 Tax=Exophiala viscosa TaxID=2486360 RepID=UPI00218E1BC9|nr:nitrogen permease regulator of amino acid transport activity 3-domain-containing protein [Exophiala viscosa]
MSTAAASRNPSLLAILLIAQGRTGSGAQLVFHYPPDPLSADRVSDTTSSAEEDDGESSSSDSEDSSSDDDFELFTKRLNAVTNNDNRSQASDEEDGDYLAKRRTQDDGDWKPPWEPLLGLGEDGLVSLLTPGRAWHKRRFELGINDLTFLGRPVYARDDGFWRKPKTRRPKSLEDETSQQSPEEGASDSENDDEVRANGTSNSQPADENKKQKDNIKEPRKTQLTMFHAVFVMDPPLLEHSFRVKEMYDHVVKKFSKVLKFEQSRHEYVWEQSELLHSIKSSHLQQRSPTKVLYTEMLRRSSLAAAIAKVFDNISASKIAAITLSSKSSASLQIPPVTSTSYLPSLTESPLEPGLWLTTATDPASTESDLDATSSSGALQLSKNFTLLLKRSPQNILKDIQAAGGPLAVPLANFIAKAKPTKSFYKISVATGLPLPDITHLARHLVYWRRAIAIPPLHQRDTYIVSPNANMNKLASACKTYEASFPMLPSLPKMLNSLSGTPTPYGSLIPSTDHKEEYYRALAWLMRDGWVTQLRTFALVRVDPEVKKAVREKERDDAKGSRTPVERDAPKNSPDLARSFGSGTPTTVASSIPSTFRQRPQRPSMVSRPSSDGRQSISTDHTSSRGTQQFKHNPKAASLILSPQRASPEESRWLDYIASTLTAAHDKSAPELSELPATDAETVELRRYWSIFVKYFTGTEALEKMPLREGLKRKFVWDMLVKMGVDFENGVEDVKGENKKVLVTIRHW